MVSLFRNSVHISEVEMQMLHKNWDTYNHHILQWNLSMYSMQYYRWFYAKRFSEA